MCVDEGGGWSGHVLGYRRSEFIGWRNTLETGTRGVDPAAEANWGISVEERIDTVEQDCRRATKGEAVGLSG